MIEMYRGFRSHLVCLPCFVGVETEAQKRGDLFSEQGVQIRNWFFFTFLLYFTTNIFSLHMLIIDPSLPLSHVSQDHYSEFWRLVFIDQLLSGTHLAFLQIHLYTFLAKFL